MLSREVRETRQVSPTQRETNTTVLASDVNGSMSPVARVQQTDKLNGNDVVGSTKKTSFPDANGTWQVNEQVETTATQTEESRSQQQRVLRQGVDGRLTVMEQTVTREDDTGRGDKRRTVEKSSVNVPGRVSDGGLRVAERATATEQTAPGGQRVINQQVEGLGIVPDGNLQVVQSSTEIVRQGTTDTNTSSTVQVVDVNGNTQAVYVDFRNSQNPPAMEIKQQAPAPSGKKEAATPPANTQAAAPPK